MSGRGRVVLWLAVAALAVAMGWALLVLVRPRPTLNGISRLIQSGRFDQVEQQFRAYLRHNPRDDAARLMLAGISVDRPDPNPDLALEQIARIRSKDDRLSAQMAVIEGKARFDQNRLDAAEAAYRRALDLDPKVAEAGWLLLNIYSLQGRLPETRALALALHAVEPDPQDRIRFLLHLIRVETTTQAARSVVQQLSPIVESNPADRYSALALGLALIRSGQADRGVALLQRTVANHPDDPDSRLAHLRGLEEAGQLDALGEALDALPAEMADDPRFASSRGRVAQERGDYAAAAEAYRRAWEADPLDIQLAYRLSRALRLAGREEEAARMAPDLKELEQARTRLRDLHDSANADPSLGMTPHPELYREIASLLERLGRLDEARAWYRLTLHDRPDDPQARDALGRLSDS